MTKIAVFGAGTWGIALARLLAVNGRDVTVWSAIPAELKSLSTTRRHPNLPGMELPSAMHYTADIAEACTGRDILLFAVPSPFVRSTAKKAAKYIPDGQRNDVFDRAAQLGAAAVGVGVNAEAGRGEGFLHGLGGGFLLAGGDN